jgi:hypothetical protein
VSGFTTLFPISKNPNLLSVFKSIQHLFYFLSYRAHRIGQTKAVFVYKLIIENSIEERILELQKKKLSLLRVF